MGAPNLEAVQAYLDSIGAGSSWTEDQITEALNAEIANQARICRVPVATVEEPDPDYPADLAEALKRRVARNLALRPLPLGIQTTMTPEGASQLRIGFDYEIRRLEGPLRKIGAKG